MSHQFLDQLRQFGGADAVIFDGKTLGYHQLLRLVDGWRDYLDRHRIRAGQVVTLEATHSPEACGALLALIERGAIVVPLCDPPGAKRAECRQVAQAEVVLGLDRAGSARSCHDTGHRAQHELYERLRAAGRPGLVLFSSGTSGRCKASVLDFHKVLCRYGPPERPRRTLSFLNLDHIGGINTLLHTLSQGGAVITTAERTPDSVFATIAAHRVGVLPTTPTFLNMVLISGAHERHDTSSLRLVTYGTEPMPQRVLQRLRAALPGVRLKQTYGLSELGILPTKSKEDGSLWIKLGGAGFEYKVVDGILWVRSDMAMLGYLNAPAPFDRDGFFNTQDAVETSDGWVRILGRRSEIINVAGEKVYPSEVENVLLAAPNVAEATVTGRPSPITGMVVQATVWLHEREDERLVDRRLRAFCGTRLEAFKVPAVVRVSEARQHSDRFKKIRQS